MMSCVLIENPDVCCDRNGRKTIAYEYQSC